MRGWSGAAWAFLHRRAGRWERGDTLIVVGAALAVLVRWGDRARYFLTWDAHMFALALERYDVNALRPHAPGYPVYVALGRVANLVLADPNEAYIALAMAATAGGAALTYAVGRRLAPRGVALGATVLLLSAPLVHIHAMTTNSYAAELAFATLVALLALRCRADPRPRNVLLLAATFALAVGVRQSMAIFLAPLVAWAALRPPWDGRTQARRLVPAVAVGLVVGLGWFLPMVAASGGLATWRRANELQSDVVFEHPVWKDGWSAVAVNLDRLQLYLQWELQVVLPVLAVLVGAGLLAWLLARPPGLPPLMPSTRQGLAFLALWTLPAFAFYVLVYSGYGNGPSGYMLILLPGGYLAASWLGAGALARLPWPRPAVALAGLLALAVAGTGLLSHVHDAADVDYRVNDAWAEEWSRLPDAFPPTNTSIVTAYNFAHLWFYYPEYHVYEYRPAGKAIGEVPDFLLIQHAYQGEAEPDWYDEIADRRTPLNHTLPPGTETLVLFDFQLAGENGGDCQLRDGCVRDDACAPGVPDCRPTYFTGYLKDGWRILYLKVTPDRPQLEDYFTLEGAAA